VYRGSEQIPYGPDNKNSSGWYYTLAENHDSVVISSNGLITVTNPGNNINIPITLRIYKGANDKYDEKELHIVCVMIEDAYHIELSNDSDVIAVANGNPIGLPITINAKVYVGNFEVVDGAWSVSAPSGWTPGTDYTVTNSNKTLTLNKLPTENGSFTFTLTKGGASLSKVFSFTTVVSDVDWNLLFDKWVINTNESEKERTVNIIIEKVDNKARTKYTNNFEGLDV
jgi:hypothetical protein